LLNTEFIQDKKGENKAHEGAKQDWVTNTRLKLRSRQEQY